MITVPQKFRLLNTPRTGSRTLSTLVRQAYANTLPPEVEGKAPFPDHHAHPEDVPTDLPLYTVIREPFDHVLSWFWHGYWRGRENAPTADILLNFVKTSRHGFFLHDRLNIYHSLDPSYMIFENGPVDWILSI
jgi:hypothetical protein